MIKKKLLSITMVCMMTMTALTACGKVDTSADQVTVGAASSKAPQAQADEKAEVKAPKYVFMFIGDGMSYPQIQLTNYYVNALANEQTPQTKVNVNGKTKVELESKNRLTMMDFDIAGSAQTYDSTSFAPDSASTATSIATGEKTWSGSINVSTDFKKEYETIAEKLKAQKDYKIGIISSVNLNHATPAGFYAHQASRNSYYEIGLEMIDSGFDYFAGGALKSTTGADKKQKDLYEVAAQKGYKVVKKQEEAKKLTKEDGKVIVIEENTADSGSLPYDLDLKNGQWALADYVEKGIEVLDNDEGFFMMVEGGKIDWACHANDAASTISDTVALDEAVAKAVDFYNEHPDETLIIVTGDHETGGLTIGYAGTNYDTFLTNLENQKISYAKFDSDYVADYKKNKTPFGDVMKDVEKLFGLKAPSAESLAGTTQKDSADLHPASGNTGALEMTEYEFLQLKAAYDETMSRTGSESSFSQGEYVMYGSYEPLTVTITHILNNISGINFASYSHTGLPVEVLVQGVGADEFDGYYDNTDIYDKLAKLTGVK